MDDQYYVDNYRYSPAKGRFSGTLIINIILFYWPIYQAIGANLSINQTTDISRTLITSVCKIPGDTGGLSRYFL